MAWLTGWGFRKEVPLPTPDSNLVDVPCRISLVADADFHEARADGYDIRITTDDGQTLCKYHRRHWTGGGGSAATAGFFTKAPSVLSAGGNKLYIYYGKSDAADGEDAINVYDSSFMAVWPLDEASGGPYLDSTSNNNDSSGGTMPDQVTGKIHKGQEFEAASSEYIATADIDLDYITISAWTKAVSGTTGWVINKNYASSVVPYGLNVGGSGSPNDLDGICRYAPPWANSTITTDVRDGTWHYVGGTYDGITLKYYVDGVLDDSSTESSGVLPKNNSMVDLGRYANDSQYFNGILEEIRISDIARGAAWINFEHANMNAPPTLGSEETAGVTLVVADGSHSHFADNIVLTQLHNLAIQAAGHSHLADNIDLTQAHLLAIAEALHSHAADGVILTQAHVLALAAALHGHTADNITLQLGALLVIADALHPHTAEGITLTQVHNLLVNSGLHSLASDPIILSQVHALAIAATTHGHLADNIILFLPAEITTRMGKMATPGLSRSAQESFSRSAYKSYKRSASND